jgi:hypothetical protein
MRTQNKAVAKGNNNAGGYDRSEKRTQDEPFRYPLAVSWSQNFPLPLLEKFVPVLEILLYKRAVAESLSRSQEIRVLRKCPTTHTSNLRLRLHLSKLPDRVHPPLAQVQGVLMVQPILPCTDPDSM